MRPIAQLVSTLERQGLRIWLSGGEVKFEGPESALVGPAFAEARRRRQEIKSLLDHLAAFDDLPLMRARRTDGPAPVSQLQATILRAEQQDRGRVNASLYLHLGGRIDPNVLAQALEDLANRHLILRARIWETEEGFAQAPKLDSRLAIDIINLSMLGPAEQAVALAAAHERECDAPMNLTEGGGFKATLFLVGEESSILALVAHNAVVDRSSFAMLRQELAEHYETRLNGRTQSLPSALQYVDYALWERDVLASIGERSRRYWDVRLEGGQALDLPVRGPREVPSASGTILLPLFPDLIVCLQALAREGAIHIMAIILSCFCAALYRWTGQKSVIGFMIGGRPEGAEGIIGPFVRPRPFYIDVAAAETFEDLLQTARQVYQEATRLGRLAPIETFERFKLQRVMANYVRTTAITGQPRSNAASRFTHFDPAVARKFRMREMNLMVIESPFDLKAILSYATGLFTEADANWLADATCRTLKEGSRNRSAKLESILADLPAPPAPAM